MTDHDDFRFRRVFDVVKASDIHPMPQQQWLDIGCHRGTFAKTVSGMGLRVTGMDVWSPQPEIDLPYVFCNCDLNTDTIPFPDGTFDFISALELIEHLIDTDRFLSHVRRTLKPGGTFVLSTPNICMLRNRFRVMFGLYPYALEFRTNIHHVRLYNLATLLWHLREHGFEIIRVEGINMLPWRVLQKGWFVRTSSLLSRLTPSLSSNLVLVARRPFDSSQDT